MTYVIEKQGFFYGIFGERSLNWKIWHPSWKNESQVGKFDGQVGKIALQVGIRNRKTVSPTEKDFGYSQNQ